jgi:hypothetical protein
MSPPKWLVVARNEYRVGTSARATLGMRLQDPILGLIGVSIIHSGFNLILGYAALLVGRRRLLAME